MPSPKRASCARRWSRSSCTFSRVSGTEDGVGYLCCGDSPTAADCSVYAQLERLVGTMGDAKVPASVPGLLDDVRLGAIKKWREMMVEKHPIRYGGKRAPRAE